MRLADFIESNCEPILDEWVEFAKTCGPAAAQLDTTALRDHALQMLQAIVVDLRTPQTGAEAIAKSKGHADGSGGPDTAAEVHGASCALAAIIGQLGASRRSGAPLRLKACSERPRTLPKRRKASMACSRARRSACRPSSEQTR